MGYPVQANAPQTVANGRTIAAGAFQWDTPIAQYFKMGLFEFKAGEWIEIEARYTEPANLLTDIQNAGGIVKYVAAVQAYINGLLVKYFPAAPAPPAGEPTTGPEAMTAVTAGINKLQLTVINGVPTLH